MQRQPYVIVSSVFLVMLTVLVITSMNAPVTPDSFWHLQMGRDMLENGLSPWVDHYSYTYYGHNITNPPFLFQGLLHLFVVVFGLMPGFYVLRFVGFLLTLVLVLFLFRQLKMPPFMYAVGLPIITLLLQFRALVRPEMFSYAFSIVALMFYFRAGSKITTRNLAPMVILMWLWGVYHSSIIGYVIFFGFFLDCAISQYESRDPAEVWVKWFAWGVIIVAVGFLNPSFSHSVVQVLTFPTEWKMLINEYLPPAVFLNSIAGFYILVLIAVLTAVMAFQQRQYGLLVVWAVLTFSAVTMQRMVTPAGIVIVLLAAFLFNNGNVSHKFGLAGKRFGDKFTNLVALVSIAIIFYSSVDRARILKEENQALYGRYPYAMADYMEAQHVSGRILNDYAMGGYLMYRLAPHNQIYIDGRSQILYPLEHVQKYKEIQYTNSPEILREELDKYSIDQIIWRYSQVKHDLVSEMGGFNLDFLDARYVLYTRNDSNFPLLGSLLSYPECWEMGMTDILGTERKKMDEILPSYSGMFPFADFVVGFSNATDVQAFFEKSIEETEWFDSMRRFAAYRFLESRNFNFVAPLLGGVTTQKPKDYLVSAYSKMEMGEIELAAKIIEEFTNVQWLHIQPEDSLIQLKLYRLLEMQRNLTPMETHRLEQLVSQFPDRGELDMSSSQELGIHSFCKSKVNQL